jgi:hypothetical protein
MAKTTFTKKEVSKLLTDVREEILNEILDEDLYNDVIAIFNAFDEIVKKG